LLSTILTNKHIKVKIRSILDYANDIDNDNHFFYSIKSIS